MINNKFLRRRVGAQAREHVIKEYAIKSVAQRYMSLYSSIIHKSVFDGFRKNIGVKMELMRA